MISRLIVALLGLGFLLLAATAITIAAGSMASDERSPLSRIFTVDDHSQMSEILAQVLPPYSANILLVTGNIFLVNSILAFCAACASGKGQSYALFFLLLLTVPALVLSIYGTVLAFQYEGMLEVATLEDQLAGLQLEMSKLQSWIFEHLRTAFVAGYESCSPVAVRTTDVRRACAAFYPESACSRIVPGYIGLFCKRATGPFEVDSTFAFQPPDQPLDYSLLETTMATGTQFSQWLNWVRAATFTLSLSAFDIYGTLIFSILPPVPLPSSALLTVMRTAAGLHADCT
jgi:hypothetical protein